MTKKRTIKPKVNLAVVLVFLLSLALLLLQGKHVAEAAPQPQHETIDGFVSFYVTGEVELEVTPTIYNVRDSQMVASVRVKKGDVSGLYDYNKIFVYHLIGDYADEIDWVKSYEADPPQDAEHYDNTFVFDFTGGIEERTHQVVFSKTINLQTNFAISAHISLD